MIWPLLATAPLSALLGFAGFLFAGWPGACVGVYLGTWAGIIALGVGLCGAERGQP